MSEVGAVNIDRVYGSREIPAESCKDIKAKAAGSKSGFYYINVDGNVVKVYCDMVRDGGGWTAVIDPTVGVKPTLQNHPTSSWAGAQYAPRAVQFHP